MHGLKQLPKSDAKCLYHHFHANQGGFDVLAFQRVATDLLRASDPKVRSQPPIATARERRARPQAPGVSSPARCPCSRRLSVHALANPDLRTESAFQTLPSRFTLQQPDWIVVIANDLRSQGHPHRNVRCLARRGVLTLNTASSRLSKCSEARRRAGSSRRSTARPMVAHPNEDGRRRADQRDRSIAKNLVAVPGADSSRSRLRLRWRPRRFGPASGARGKEFWVFGAAGLCLIKATATSLAADLIIATGALPVFLKIDMVGGFESEFTAYSAEQPIRTEEAEECR